MIFWLTLPCDSSIKPCGETSKTGCGAESMEVRIMSSDRPALTMSITEPLLKPSVLLPSLAKDFPPDTEASFKALACSCEALNSFVFWYSTKAERTRSKGAEAALEPRKPPKGKEKYFSLGLAAKAPL